LAYCYPTDIRTITGLTSTEVDDAVLTYLISYATTQLNHDVQIKWEDEPVIYISSEKKNDIDGSNKVFYTKNYPIGDSNDDGSVSVSDIYFYTLKGDGTRTDYTVSAITDADKGKITLITAPPSGEEPYMTYYSCPISINTPHPLIKLACIQLTAALAFTRIDSKKVAGFRVGKIAVTKQSQAFTKYLDEYQRTIYLIKSYSVKEGKFVDQTYDASHYQ
jgi:hypothetical protein